MNNINCINGNTSNNSCILLGEVVSKKVFDLYSLVVTKKEEAFCNTWASLDKETKIQVVGNQPWLCHLLEGKLSKAISFLLQQNETNVQKYIQSKQRSCLEYAEDLCLPPDIIEEIRKKDGGFTEELFWIRFLYLAFDIQGHQLEFSGSFERHRPSMIHLLKNVLESNALIGKVGPQMIETLLSSLQTKEEILARVQAGKWSLIPTAWILDQESRDSHAICVLFSKDYYIKIDTAQRVDIFRITRLVDADLKKIIDTLFEPLKFQITNKKDNRTYIEGIIPDLLGLQKITSFVYPQIAPNCMWFSLKASTAFLFLLQELKGKTIDEESLQKVFFQANTLFSLLADGPSRREVANVAIPLLKKHQNLVDLNLLFTQIFSRCIDYEEIDPVLAVLEEFPQFSHWVDPSTEKSLPQLFASFSRGAFFDSNYYALYDLCCVSSKEVSEGKKAWRDQHKDKEGKTLQDTLFSIEWDIEDLEEELGELGVDEIEDLIKDEFAKDFFVSYRTPSTKESLEELAEKKKCPSLLAFYATLRKEDLRSQMNKVLSSSFLDDIRSLTQKPRTPS